MKILFIQILAVLVAIMFFVLIFSFIMCCITPEEIQDEVKERKAQIKTYLKGWFTK